MCAPNHGETVSFAAVQRSMKALEKIADEVGEIRKDVLGFRHEIRRVETHLAEAIEHAARCVAGR